jgi:hypothetical protein
VDPAEIKLDTSLNIGSSLRNGNLIIINCLMQRFEASYLILESDEVRISEIRKDLTRL